MRYARVAHDMIGELLSLYRRTLIRLFSRRVTIERIRIMFAKLYRVDLDLAVSFLLERLSELYSVPVPEAYLLYDEAWSNGRYVVVRLGCYVRNKLGITISSTTSWRVLMETIAHEFFHHLVEQSIGHVEDREFLRLEEVLADRFAKFVSGVAKTCRRS
ncbi:MAG: hypothetical protein DRO39_00875 [Thermoprotei archaeon]|nr:MAG: hypothetical protein DRO39_00875 [Thermoprotei archaeon]